MLDAFKTAGSSPPHRPRRSSTPDWVIWVWVLVGFGLVVRLVLKTLARIARESRPDISPIELPMPITLDDFIAITIFVIAGCVLWIARQGRKDR